MTLTARALGVGVPSALGYLVGELTLGAAGAIVAAAAGGMAGVVIELIRSSAAARTERIKLIQVVNDERKELSDRSDKIHAQQVKFLQDSLRYRATLEVIARENAHNAMGEVWRCQLQIRTYEDMLKDADVEFQPFQIRGYDDLRSKSDLPLPPQIGETGKDE